MSRADLLGNAGHVAGTPTMRRRKHLYRVAGLGGVGAFLAWLGQPILVFLITGPQGDAGGDWSEIESSRYHGAVEVVIFSAIGVGLLFMVLPTWRILGHRIPGAAVAEAVGNVMTAGSSPRSSAMRLRPCRVPHLRRPAGVAGSVGLGTGGGAPAGSAVSSTTASGRPWPASPCPLPPWPGVLAWPRPRSSIATSRTWCTRPARSPTSCGRPSSTTTAWSPRSSTALRTTTSSTSGSPHRSRSCFSPPSISPRSVFSSRRWPTPGSTLGRAVSRSTSPSSTAGSSCRCPTTAAACPPTYSPGSGCTRSLSVPPSSGVTARYDRAASGCRLCVTLTG